MMTVTIWPNPQAPSPGWTFSLFQRILPIDVSVLPCQHCSKEDKYRHLMTYDYVGPLGRTFKNIPKGKEG
jgi:hypothetical protein